MIKIKNIINLSLKNQLRNKTIILNIILISIAFLIIISVNTYAKTSINYLNSKDYYNSVYFHSLEVGASKGLDITLEEVKKIDHVTVATKIYEYKAFLESVEFKNKNSLGYVTIFYANNESLPEITYGSNFPDSDDENYVICPERLNVSGGWDYINSTSTFSLINMKEYLDKEINFKYYSAIEENPFKETFKVIGLYKPKVYLDTQVCFSKVETISKIVNNQFSDYFDSVTHEPAISYQDSILIQIDDVSNKEYVKNELSKLGYHYYEVTTMDSSYFYDLEDNMIKISTTVLLITLPLLIILFLKQTKENENFYKLIEYLGYNSTKRKILLITCNIINLLISFMVVIFLLIIAFVILKIVLYIYPYLIYGLDIKISYISILYIILIVSIALTISTIINIIKIKGVCNDKIN